jgi:hypothetical protein
MVTKTNKILGAVVAIALIIAVIVFVYVNLPKQTTTPSENNTDHNTTAPSILTVVYGNHQMNYSLSNLTHLPSYTARGGYRTQAGFIKGLGNYTGVNITTLVETFQPAPLQYSIKIISDDGSNKSYNYSTILGDVYLYNPDNASDPNPIGKGNTTMVLVYQYEGNWLNETNDGNDGKLKIAFLDESGSITQSSLWWKKVVSIRIITE